MSAADTAVGLLLLSSIILALAQWRGYHPVEGALSRVRSEIDERRSQESGSPEIEASDPRGRPETDGGRETVGEIEQRDADRDPRSTADDRDQSDPWAAPGSSAPVRPIRVDESDVVEPEIKTLTLTVPEGVEIEIERGEP